jgi:hypothetical protein
MKGSGESIQIDEKINSVSFEDDPISLQRREKVKDAMIHAWTSYEKYAWGKDELKVLFPLVNIFLYSSLQFCNYLACFSSRSHDQ